MRIYLRLLVVSLLLFAGNLVYAEAQQEKRVTGTVTSEGEPLPGVSVQLKGASSGTITDIDGKYSIEVPATGTLVFRFVGMRTVEQPVNNRSVINVTLESESKELEEVMVVAYATAKKYSFTGAASTMKAGEIEKLQTSSISRVLEGTVSGVQASAASGQPGTDAEIRIRGIGSINASSAPLYVVDGVPFDGSVNSINPDDISSMTVLKDAASAALYGSRGANGVIIITTKQGDQNTKATVKVKASLGGSNRAVRDYDRVSTDQYFELYWEALRNQYAKSADYTPATAAAQASKDLVTKLMGGGPNPYGPQYAQPVGTDGKLVAGARPLWNSDWRFLVGDAGGLYAACLSAGRISGEELRYAVGGRTGLHIDSAGISGPGDPGRLPAVFWGRGRHRRAGPVDGGEAGDKKQLWKDCRPGCCRPDGDMSGDCVSFL